MVKLLSIDDEVEFTSFIREYFELRGFAVFTANDGEAGLEIFRRERPDVVLIDLKMPGKHGDQVMKEIHQMRADLPIIMITASQGVGKTRARLKDLGAFACFDKPLKSIKELESTVKEAVKGHE